MQWMKVNRLYEGAYVRAANKLNRSSADFLSTHSHPIRMPTTPSLLPRLLPSLIRFACLSPLLCNQISRNATPPVLRRALLPSPEGRSLGKGRDTDRIDKHAREDYNDCIREDITS